MSVDMTQFHQTYLEEAVENLAELESGLLELEKAGEADLNAIFRAAHSIKGGAATFGFEDIASFTHGVETVLDKGRDASLPLTADVTATLLRAVDVLSDLVMAAREGRKAQPADRAPCEQALSAICTASVAAPVVAEAESAEGIEQKVVDVLFKPHANLPQTGSDPLNILRELRSLGDLSLTAKIESVPPLNELDAESLFLWWQGTLETEHPMDDIYDVFLFVQDEAEIALNIIASMTLPVADTQRADTPLVAEPMDNRRAEGAERRMADRRAPDRPAQDTSFIRVATDKVDHLINLIGELVTTNAMVSQHAGGVDADGHAMLHGSVAEMKLPHKMHIVFCRNVIIYFGKQTKITLFQKVAAHMPVGGLLFIGHSESMLGISDAFKLLGRTAYERV